MLNSYSLYQTSQFIPNITIVFDHVLFDKMAIIFIIFEINTKETKIGS